MTALYAGRADMIIHILEAERAQLQRGTQGTLRQPRAVSCHRETGIDKKIKCRGTVHKTK